MNIHTRNASLQMQLMFVLFFSCCFSFYYIAIVRASGYYFYSYDSSELFDPDTLDLRNLIYHHDPMSGCPASLQNITVNRVAQEIAFINKRPQDYRSNCAGDNLWKTIVDICEVKVMGMFFF